LAEKFVKWLIGGGVPSLPGGRSLMCPSQIRGSNCHFSGTSRLRGTYNWGWRVVAQGVRAGNRNMRIPGHLFTLYLLLSSKVLHEQAFLGTRCNLPRWTFWIICGHLKMISHNVSLSKIERKWEKNWTVINVTPFLKKINYKQFDRKSGAWIQLL